jgi:hypothetical protein
MTSLQRIRILLATPAAVAAAPAVAALAAEIPAAVTLEVAVLAAEIPAAVTLEVAILAAPQVQWRKAYSSMLLSLD